jgi:hypothetical protein
VRNDFQLDLGLVLLDYVIELDWDGKSDKRPGWIRQKDYVQTYKWGTIALSHTKTPSAVRP